MINLSEITFYKNSAAQECNGTALLLITWARFGWERFISSNTFLSWRQYIATRATFRSGYRCMFLTRLSVFLFAVLATVAQGQVDSRGEHSDAITMSGNQPDDRNFTDIASLDRQFPIGHDNGATNSGNMEVEIPNERLRVALERELRKESGAIITVADMLTLTELSAESMGISDLTGLEFATGLVSLYFANNEIKDLSPLSGLFGLETLHLKNNKIVDLSPLSSLIELDWLVLSNNKIADVLPLKGMVGLKGLTLSNNEIEDLSPLSGLTGLSSLYIANNEIVDLSSLKGLSGLKYLDIDNNQIADVLPMSYLTRLEYLNLNGNEIFDLSPMSGLTWLEWLELDNNEIADITPLLENLDLGEGDFVDLRHNQFKDNLAKVHSTVLEGRGVMVLIND